jgi:hypothetical protein
VKGFNRFPPAKKGSTAANGPPARGYYLRYDAYYKLHTSATLLSIQSTAVDCGLSQSLTPADWIGLDLGGPPEVRTGSDRASRSDPVCSPGRTVRNTEHGTTISDLVVAMKEIINFRGIEHRAFRVLVAVRTLGKLWQ